VKLRVEVTADRRFGTNSYLVVDDDTHDAAVIDSNLEPDLVVELAREHGANVKAIVLTHTDLDHIAYVLHRVEEEIAKLRSDLPDAEAERGRTNRRAASTRQLRRLHRRGPW